MLHPSKVKRNGQVTIPKSIRKRLGIRDGAMVFFEMDGESARIIPTVLIPKDQAWFWTPEWQKREQEADKDMKEGRSKTFTSAKDAITWLNRKRR